MQIKDELTSNFHFCLHLFVYISKVQSFQAQNGPICEESNLTNSKRKQISEVLNIKILGGEILTFFI